MVMIPSAALLPSRHVRGVVVLLLAVCLAGCIPKLVQPYDESLVAGTEALYSEAAALIDEGIASSPRTDEEREAISFPALLPSHFSLFAPRYDQLIRSSDLMILRAMAGSDGVDRFGQKLQGKIEEAIENAVPSVCAELTDSFNELGVTSLTVRNQVDLKCLLTRWKEQHADPELTRGTFILKRANWETRRASLFRVVLAIQRAQLSKQP